MELLPEGSVQGTSTPSGRKKVSDLQMQASISHTSIVLC